MDSPLDPDLDGIYTVEYGEKYLVGVKRGASPVPAKNVRVVVKDASGNTVAMTNPIIESKRSINLANKSLAGQEITADIFVKGETDRHIYFKCKEKDNRAHRQRRRSD